LSASKKRDALAVFDVGTNTVLYLLMARQPGGELAALDEGVAPTRLGEGLAAGGKREAAIARTLEALASFVERARRAGATAYKVVGTEALRRGEWRREFAAAVAERFGLAVEVLSPQEEGELALLAARRSLPLGGGPLTVADVGGGSAQLARERGDGATTVESFAVGCVLVTEKFLTAEPSALAWEEARRYVRAALADVLPAEGEVVVTGGTATTLVTLSLDMAAYDPARVHGHVLATEEIAARAESTYYLPLERRRGLVGMEAARADVFPAGALAIAELLGRLGAERATVSAQGVRFGVAYRYFDAV
jgi:exopolyphosphatase/guanosine-5'-triphosphate,3'-diphosphate pyrophosphatase